MIIETLTVAATAVATILGEKILEKAGDRIGDAISDKTAAFLRTLNQASPETVKAIEEEPAESLDYIQVVSVVSDAIKTSPEVAQTTEELMKVIEEEPLPNLAEWLDKIGKALESQSSQSDIYKNEVEKIINFAQGKGASIHIGSQTINI